MQWSGHLIHFLLNPQRRLAPLRQGHTFSLPLNFRRRRLSQPPQKTLPGGYQTTGLGNHPVRPSSIICLLYLIPLPSPLSPPSSSSSPLETPRRRNVIGGGCCCCCFCFLSLSSSLLPLSSPFSPHIYSTLPPLSYLCKPPQTNPQKQLPPSVLAVLLGMGDWVSGFGFGVVWFVVSKGHTYVIYPAFSFFFKRFRVCVSLPHVSQKALRGSSSCCELRYQIVVRGRRAWARRLRGLCRLGGEERRDCGGGV